MGLAKIVASRGWKKFMAYLYGWGASLVIIGALFKIMHYQGAGLMLLLGMGTEAVIFFFSAFEKPHEDPEWERVYPQLKKDGSKGSAVEASGDAVQSLNKMFEEAKVGPELIKSLGQGMRSLSDNAAQLSNVSDAAVASSEFAVNLKKASNSVGELSQTLSQDGDATRQYVANMKDVAGKAGDLSEAYSQAASVLKNDMNATEEFTSNIKSAAQSANVLADKYTKSAEVITKSLEYLDFSSVDGNAYNEQITKISSNLAALNAVYEMQLQSTNHSFDATKKLESTMDAFLNNLNESADQTAQYKNQVDVLTQKVAALNNVYGNMLSAMNVKA